MWEFLNTARWIMLGKAPRGRRDVVVPLRRTPKYEVMLPQIVEMAEAGSGIDLISRALGIGAEVVRDALYLHRTGKRPPGRIDGRRRRPRKPGQPFVPRGSRLPFASHVAISRSAFATASGEPNRPKYKTRPLSRSRACPL